MNKKVLIACFLALGALGVTMVSTGFELRTGQDYGGGAAMSTSYDLKGSIGGAVAGEASSTGYVCYVGPLRHATEAKGFVEVESVSKEALTTLEQCLIDWHSTVDGTFYVEVGGDGTPGSGTQVETGPCTADVTLTSTVYETDLADNQQNTIYIIVDDGVYTHYAVVVLTDDQVGPDVAFTQIVIDGTVDDATVTEVVVNGVPVPVIAGAYQATVSTGLTEILIEATNADSQKVQRWVRVQ